VSCAPERQFRLKFMRRETIGVGWPNAQPLWLAGLTQWAKPSLLLLAWTKSIPNRDEIAKF